MDETTDMEDIIVKNQKKDGDLLSLMGVSRDQEMTPCEAGIEDHEL